MNQSKPIDLLFLGTYDFYISELKTASIQVASGMVVNDEYDNVRIGRNAGADRTTGRDNTCFGNESLRHLTIGQDNISIGTLAMHNATGRLVMHNVAMGNRAMYSGTNPQRCVTLGYKAGESIHEAVDCVCVGTECGNGTTDAFSSVYVGNQCGYTGGGSYNTAVGHKCGYKMGTSAEYNALFGFRCGNQLTTADSVVAVGYKCAHNMTTAGNSVLVGTEAGLSLNGARCVMIGDRAGRGGSNTNEISVAAGNNHLFYSNDIADETKYDCTIPDGYYTIESLNTFLIDYLKLNHNGITLFSFIVNDTTNKVGIQFSEFTGWYVHFGATSPFALLGFTNPLNVPVGKSNSISYVEYAPNVHTFVDPALYTSTDCVYIGKECGYMGGGSNNTMIGNACGHDMTTASGNVAIGYQCMYKMTDGVSNIPAPGQEGWSVCVGLNAGYNYNGRSCVIIGDNSGKGTNASYDSVGCVYIGSGCAELNGSGNACVAIGDHCNYSVANSAQNNVSIGSYASYYHNTGDGNVIIGDHAANGNGAAYVASNCVCIGRDTLYLASGTVSNVISIGKEAAYSSGADNSIYIGTACGRNATSDAKYNVIMGYQSGMAVQTEGNTLIGYECGKAITQAQHNVAIGYRAMYSATTGILPVSAQSGRSVCVGDKAGYFFNGDNSVIIGDNAGYGGVGDVADPYNGKGCVFIGSGCAELHGAYEACVAIGDHCAWSGNKLNISNVAIGSYAAEWHNLGDTNVFIGSNAGKGTGVAFDANACVAIGSGAMQEATGSKLSSVAIGQGAASSGGGTYSVYIGALAGFLSGDGDQSVNIGYRAGYTGAGQDCVCIGTQAGYNLQKVVVGETTTRAQRCICIGTDSLNAATTAVDVISIGSSAGYRNNANNVISIGSSAAYNYNGANSVIIGTLAGFCNDYASPTPACTSSNSIVMGTQAGYKGFGNSSVILGYQTGYDSTGVNSVLIGTGAGRYVTGTSNVCVGCLAAVDLTSATYCVCVGYTAGDNCVSSTSVVAIGAGCKASANYAISIGGSIGAAMTNSSGDSSIAIGRSANAQNNGAISIGATSFASINAIAIGVSASAEAENSIAIGTSTQVTGEGIALGRSAVANAGQCVIGPYITDFRLSGVGATYFPSDRRLKCNITPLILDSLPIIEQLRICSFNSIAQPTGKKLVGVIAQDVEILFQNNELQNTKTVDYVESEDRYYLSIDMIFMTHIKATQELSAKVKSLATENDLLKSRLSAIEARLGIV